MKILFLDQFGEIGGAQRVLLDTIQAVEQRGWTARAVVPAGPLTSQLRQCGVPVTEIPCGPYRGGRKSAADLWRFALDLPRQARIVADLTSGGRFELVYVNGPRLLPAVSLGSRCRVAFHAHSHIPQSSARWLSSWSIGRAQASVVACSQSVANAFRDTTPDLQVIPNGVAEVPFLERGFGRGGPWCIGVVGRISPEKGQAEFLEAVRLLHSRGANARFLISGSPLFGATAYFDRVRKLAGGLPVEFRAWQENIDSLYRDLDLLVVPSKLEGMGRVILEAFSAGVPVLAFPTGGLPEVIVDGETGYLTRGLSPEALARGIEEILACNLESLRRVVTNARRAWQQNYTVTLYQQRIVEWIASLVPAPAATRETAALPGSR